MLRFSQIPVTLSVWTSFSRRLKQNKTKQNLHVQTKVSIFRPPLQIPNAQRQRPPPRLDNRTARSYPTTRAPRSETQGPEPTGKPGPACRVRPGPSFQWNRREWGREGAEARVQTAATELRLVSLPGVFGLGEVHPDGGRGQAGFSRRAGGRCEAQAAGRRGLAGLAGLSPQSLKALSMRLPPPKMATWAAGEPGRRGWGRGEKRQKQKGAPPPTPERWGRPASQWWRAGAPAENAAGRGNGLTFSCRSRRRRPPWRIGPLEAFTAGRPQARSGLIAGSFHKRGEKGKHVQRWEVQGAKPLVKRREEEQAAIARVQVQLRRASPRAACQGPAQRTDRSSGEADLPVSSDEVVLCTEELRQRQGAGKGGGALGDAQGMGGGRGECRGRARPRIPARAHASPPHLRGRRVPWEPMARDAGGQSHPSPRLSQPIRRRSAEAQLGRAAALTCSSVCSCGGKRKEVGCGQPGSGDSLPSPRESSGWLWEALLRRDFGCWVSSLHHISCSRCSKSPALFLFYGCVVQGCRQFCWVPVQQNRLFASWQKTLSIRCLDVLQWKNRLCNHGPCHRPHSAVEHMGTLLVHQVFLWWRLITE